MRNFLHYFLLLTILLGFGGLLGCSTKQQSPAVAFHSAEQQQLVPLVSYLGERVFQHNGNPVAWEVFIERLSQADYILLGETHTNATHHQMQARILKALAEKGVRPLLGLEMLTKQEQSVLDAYNKGAIALEALPKTLDWERVWGFDFSLYAPVFQVAKNFSVPLYGLNIPQETLKAVRAKGLHGLTAEERSFAPIRIIAPHHEQHKRLQAFFKQHAGMLAQAQKIQAESSQNKAVQAKNIQTEKGEAQKGGAQKSGVQKDGVQKDGVQKDGVQKRKVQQKVILKEEQKEVLPRRTEENLSERFLRFMLIQSLWDNTMAENAMKARVATHRPMVILAGSEHVRYGFGIAHKLQYIDPDAKSVMVLPIPHAPTMPAFEETAKQKKELAPTLPFPAHFYVYSP